MSKNSTQTQDGTKHSVLTRGGLVSGLHGCPCEVFHTIYIKLSLFIAAANQWQSSDEHTSTCISTCTCVRTGPGWEIPAIPLPNSVCKQYIAQTSIKTACGYISQQRASH